MVSMLTTWIVVADASKASILTYHGPDRELEYLPNGKFTHDNSGRDETAQGERGRVFHSADGSRSAMEPPLAAKEKQQIVFAEKVAQFLNEHVDDYDRLIVTSAPKMLGSLRQAMNSHSLDKLSAELDKDLTQVSIKALPKHLSDVIYFN